MNAQDSSPDSAWVNFDRLWNYSKPAETEQKFLEILPDVPLNSSYHVELLTQIARTQGLQRKFEIAHRLLDEAELILSEHDMKRPRVRYLLERGRAYNSSGQKEKALPLFTEAWELGKEIGEDALAIDAVHMIAIAEESTEEQIKWHLKGLELVEQTEDKKARGWAAPLYNNLGWSYHELGKYEEALETFRKGLAWREEHSQNQRGIRIAKWTVARTIRSLGRIKEALELQLELEKDWAAAGEPGMYVFEELAICYKALDDMEKAAHYARLAHKELSKDTWFVANETERLKLLQEIGEITE